MTVKELYSLAKSLMFEKANSKDYDSYYISHINVLLMENFKINNNMRIAIGKEILDTVPYVSNDEDVIPYEDCMNRNILPYGLAARFFIDDDLSKFDIMNTMYENARTVNSAVIPVDIEDIYRSEEEC